MAWPSCPQCRDYMDYVFCAACTDVVWACCVELVECVASDYPEYYHPDCSKPHYDDCPECEKAYSNA